MSATKLHLLDLGRLTVDDGFFIRGCGCATRSNPSPGAVTREVAAMAAVIEHPTAGPILFDTGCAQNAAEEWPPAAFEAFPVTTYDESHHLDNALAAAGFGIGDIQAVVMSHMHLDHAGGLEKFVGRDIWLVDRTATNYVLGWELARLGRRADPWVGLVARAQPLLQELADAFNESVTFSVPNGEGGLDLVAEAAGSHVLGALVRNMIGNRYPLHASSTGKVLLAERSAEVTIQVPAA